MKNRYIISAAVAIAVIAAGIYFVTAKNSFKKEKLVIAEYYCPVHEAVTSDKPGKCPICHRNLVPRMKKPAPQEIQELDNQEEYEDASASDDEGNRSGEEEQASIGRAVIQITEQEEKKAGVRTAAVEKRQILVKIQASGVYSVSGEKPPASADISYSEAAYVTSGAKVSVYAAAAPEKEIKGAVDSVEKTPGRSTARVYLKLENEEQVLKDNDGFDAVIYSDLGERLSVPAEALFDTGEKQFVYVKTGPGKFEPRQIKVGAINEKAAEALSGVTEGEAVVTSGTFLVEAQSKAAPVQEKHAGE